MADPAPPITPLVIGTLRDAAGATTARDAQAGAMPRARHARSP